MYGMKVDINILSGLRYRYLLKINECDATNIIISKSNLNRYDKFEK